MIINKKIYNIYYMDYLDYEEKYLKYKIKLKQFAGTNTIHSNNPKYEIIIIRCNRYNDCSTNGLNTPILQNIKEIIYDPKIINKRKYISIKDNNNETIYKKFSTDYTINNVSPCLDEDKLRIDYLNIKDNTNYIKLQTYDSHRNTHEESKDNIILNNTIDIENNINNRDEINKICNIIIKQIIRSYPNNNILFNLNNTRFYLLVIYNFNNQKWIKYASDIKKDIDDKGI